MGPAIASSVFLQSDLEPRYLVNTIADAIGSRIWHGLNNEVTKKVRPWVAFEAAYTVIVKLAGRLVSRLQYNEIITEVARNIAAIILGSSGMPDGRESAQLNGAAAKKANNFALQLQYPGIVTEITRDMVRYVLDNLSNRLASQPFPEIVFVHDYTVGVAVSTRC